jgi:hypothetical protein
MCFKRESLGRHDGGAGTTIISLMEHDGRLVRRHLAHINVFGVILDKEMREFMGVNGGPWSSPISSSTTFGNVSTIGEKSLGPFR